jgi:hypothetical protein
MKKRNKRYNVKLTLESYNKYFEIKDWLQQNIGKCIQDGKLVWRVTRSSRTREQLLNNSHFYNYRYSFLNEKDAVLFLLKWA